MAARRTKAADIPGPDLGPLIRAVALMGPIERARLIEGLPDDEVVALDAEWDAAVRSDLLVWSCEALAGMNLTPAAHHRLLVEELERLALDPGHPAANDRLMVLMPPGSAKSTYASVIFPPWFMQRMKGALVIGASHTADLAVTFSRRILGLVREHGPLLGLRLANENVLAWGTREGAEYKAAGVGGPITGRRADLAIVDDPVKSRVEADSEAVRARTWDWFRSELLTRMKPNGRIVLIMTRWHEDDLAGRLLEHEEDRWRVLCLPALAEAGDPLGRKPGEPLWPEWESGEKLADKQRTMGEREWTALFQQSPRPTSGLLFEVGRLGVVEEAPPCVTVARGWDLAATEAVATTNPDWTVGAKIGRTAEGRFVILDIVRMRGRPEAVERTLRGTAEADGRSVRVSLPQDPGQAGKSQAEHLARLLAGFDVKTSRESGAKATRAAPLAAQVNSGNVAMVRAPWNRDLVEEMRGFPASRKDDQVDALARAFEMIATTPTKTRRVALPFMAR